MILPFDLDTYRGRLARVRQQMSEDDIDCIVTTLPDSIHWLTGFDTIGYLWSQALIIDKSDQEPYLVTRTSEGPGAAATCWLSKPRLYDISTEDPAQIIAEYIVKNGYAAGKIGIDLQAFTLVPELLDRLKSQIPRATWKDTTWLVAEQRLIKEAHELHYQRQAAKMADYAVQRVIEAVRPGVSESQLAGIASLALGDAGSEYAAIPPMVVSGDRSALVHGLSTRRSLALGDVVCVELAGVVHRYHAVVMRTVIVGQAAPRVREVYGCLERAMEAALASIKPGAGVALPDQACNEILAELDLVQRRCHRIGYSLGIAYPPGWLEPMTLVDGDSHSFAPGMSFTLEPNLSLPHDGFGLKLGETVACTASGAETLSTLSHSLVEVE